jgi:hypothetical protein
MNFGDKSFLTLNEGRWRIVLQHELEVDGDKPNFYFDAAGGLEPVDAGRQQSHEKRRNLETGSGRAIHSHAADAFARLRPDPPPPAVRQAARNFGANELPTQNRQTHCKIYGRSS